MTEKPVKVYTNEVIIDITAKYTAAPTAETVAILAKELEVSDRSVIAKLSSLGIYVKKQYVNKRGDLPVSKEVYIARIAELLDIDICMMESLEKTTKQLLILMESRIKELSE